jgi:indole-3-glycerol phosphate synthase
MNQADILQRIIATKKTEVALKKKHQLLKKLADTVPILPIRPFAGVIGFQLSRGQPAVIAEIKKASPSQGVIRADFDVEAIAVSYAQAGAACLSVLTDVDYFQGHESYILAAKSEVHLPILRKDFIIDAYQVQESQLLGADCILLIAAALAPEQLFDYAQQAQNLGLDVLVEIHDEQELKTAIRSNCTLIGINHRNLRTFEVDLSLSQRLVPQIPEDRIIVAESGIHTQQQVAYLMEQGIATFLVGEAFMRAADPGAALRDVFGFLLPTASGDQVLH